MELDIMQSTYDVSQDTVNVIWRAHKRRSVNSEAIATWGMDKNPQISNKRGGWSWSIQKIIWSGKNDSTQHVKVPRAWKHIAKAV